MAAVSTSGKRVVIGGLNPAERIDPKATDIKDRPVSFSRYYRNPFRTRNRSPEAASAAVSRTVVNECGGDCFYEGF